MANTTTIPDDAAVQTAPAPTLNRALPDDDAVQLAPGGGASWRFSKGQIVTGREPDGTLQSRPRIVGRLTRIGIFRGETNDQYKKPYEHLEADIETSKGPIYLKASLLDEDFNRKITRGALDFAWGLIQIKDSETVVLITAAQGEAWTNNKGQPMSPSTYVNFAIVGDDNQARPLYKPKRDPNAPKVSMDEQFSFLQYDLESHPLWAPRPANSRRDEEAEAEGGAASSSGGHLQAFCRECASRGWPTPEQAPTEWLQMVAIAVGESPRPSLASYADEDWAWVSEQVKGQSEIPAMLMPAKQRIEAASRPAPKPAPAAPAAVAPKPAPTAPATIAPKPAPAPAAPKPVPAPSPAAPASPFGASYPAGHAKNAANEVDIFAEP